MAAIGAARLMKLSGCYSSKKPAPRQAPEKPKPMVAKTKVQRKGAKTQRRNDDKKAKKSKADPKIKAGKDKRTMFKNKRLALSKLPLALWERAG
jgi:hypothetical protein